MNQQIFYATNRLFTDKKVEDAHSKKIPSISHVNRNKDHRAAWSSKVIVCILLHEHSQ